MTPLIPGDVIRAQLRASQRASCRSMLAKVNGSCEPATITIAGRRISRESGWAAATSILAVLELGDPWRYDGQRRDLETGVWFAKAVHEGESGKPHLQTVEILIGTFHEYERAACRA